MNFLKLTIKLEKRLYEILDNVIEEHHIKDAARILNQFAKLHISEPEIKAFLKNVLLYFLLLNNYIKQFSEMTPQQEYTVRIALEIFVTVVDSTEIHQKIIRKFVRIIDAMLESDAPNSNIRECLRVYLYLLDKIPKGFIQNLAVKHKTYPNLYNIIKNTCDVATQAIIIELVLKFYKYSDSPKLNGTFKEFLPLAEISQSDEKTVYQNIRMILDHLNENSENIFSINCVTIELDSERVLEFKDAETTNDIWLDFNLLQKKLSFFCHKNFTCLINDLRFKTATSWEVISFSVKDMLRATFEYDKPTKNLIILCKIKTSSFALFQNMRFGRIMSLKIVISKYSNRFLKLIKEVLPKLFKDSFYVETLNISAEQDNDSSVTPDIEITNQSEDSSPIIEHFEKSRKKISTRNEDYLPDMNISANSSAESIITISDDDEDEVQQQQLCSSAGSVIDISKSRKISGSPFVRNYYDFYTDFNKFREIDNVNSTEVCKKRDSKKIGTLNTKAESPSHKCNELESNANSRSYHVVPESIFVDNVAVNDNNNEPENLNTRVSTLTKDAAQLNKSISPISFSESVFGKSFKSAEICDRSSSNTNLKMSSFVKKFEGPKISTPKTKVTKMKISSSLLSPVVSSSKNVKSAEKKTSLPEKKCVGAIDLVEEEDIIDNSFREDNIRSSIVKVCSWLNQVTTPSPARENEKPVDFEMTLPEVNQPLQRVPTQISQRSSDLPPERRLEILMQEDVEDLAPVLDKSHENQHSTTVEDLVHILESQDVPTFGDGDGQTTISKIANASEDSEGMPLSMLKKKLQMENENNLKDVQDSIQFDSNNNNVNEKRITIEDKDLSAHDVEINEAASDLGRVEDESPEKVDKFDELISKEPIKVSNDTSFHSHDASVKDNLQVSMESSGSTKSSKRKLYNPNDLSYLSKTFTEEYLKNREPIERHFFGPQTITTPKGKMMKNNMNKKREVLDSKGTRSKVTNKKGKNKNDMRSSSTKKNSIIRDSPKDNTSELDIIEIRSNPRKPNKTEKLPRKTRKNSTKPKVGLELTKSDIFGDDSKIKTHMNGTFTKVFNSLKEKIRKHDKQSKEHRRKLGLKRRSSLSSVESMEPFGVAVSNSLKKVKLESDSKNLEEKHNHRVEVNPKKKINVISNILLAPALNQNLQSLEPTGGCCCEHLFKVSSDFFLQSMMHVQKCKPHLINSDKYKATMSSLKAFFRENNLKL